jgi:hypothetical protein
MSAEDETPSINLQEEFRTEGGTNNSGNVNSNQSFITSQSLTASGVPLVIKTDQILNLTYLRASKDFTPENIWRLKDECRRKLQAGNEFVIKEQFHTNLRDQIPGILLAGGLERSLAENWEDALNSGTLQNDEFFDALAKAKGGEREDIEGVLALLKNLYVVCDPNSTVNVGVTFMEEVCELIDTKAFIGMREFDRRHSVAVQNVLEYWMKRTVGIFRRYERTLLVDSSKSNYGEVIYQGMCKGTLESTLFGFTKRLVEVCNKVRQSLDFAISLGAKFPHEIKSIKDSSQEGSGKRTWEDSFKSSQSGTKKKPKVQSEEKTLHNCCGTYHKNECYYKKIAHPDLNKQDDMKFIQTKKGDKYARLRISQLKINPGGLIAK